jgi:hypothetical protein
VDKAAASCRTPWKSLDITDRISYSWSTLEQIDVAAPEGGFAILGYPDLPKHCEVSCAKK